MCRANVLVPVVLRLEDYGFHLSYEAVSLIIEFVYKGEVNIASNQLIVMATAAHSLGIDGLQEFLPNTLPPNANQNCTQNDGKRCKLSDRGKEDEGPRPKNLK